MRRVRPQPKVRAVSDANEPDDPFVDFEDSLREVEALLEPDENKGFGEINQDPPDENTLPPLPLPSFEPTIEHYLISAIGLDLNTLTDVSSIVTASDFQHPALRVVFDAMLRCRERVARDGMIEFQLLASELERQGLLEAIGGIGGLAELHDLEASPGFMLDYAFKVRLASVEREIARLAAGIHLRPDDREAYQILQKRVSEREELEVRYRSGRTDTLLTGAALQEIAESTTAESPLPGFFDPEPSLHILHGPAKTGKTSLAWLWAIDWSLGLPPWVGASAFPRSRVLVLSAEQSANKCVRVLNRIGESAGLGHLPDWKDGISIVANRHGAPPAVKTLLRFDQSGFKP